VNRSEADAVLKLLSAGFPRQEWPGPTKDLWRAELEEVGASEGMAAARAVIRGREFLTLKAFFDELAVVRERALDELRSRSYKPDYLRLALPAGDEGAWRERQRQEGLAHIAAIRSRLSRRLATDLEDRPVRTTRRRLPEKPSNDRPHPSPDPTTREEP
jgi:hypothetical protein